MTELGVSRNEINLLYIKILQGLKQKLLYAEN